MTSDYSQQALLHFLKIFFTFLKPPANDAVEDGCNKHTKNQIMRRLLLSTITLLTTLATFSQHVHIGPMMGLNYSNIQVNEQFMIGDNSYSFATANAGSGVMAGAFVEFGYNKLFVQPQFMFSQNSSDINFTADNHTMVQRMTVHNIQMPVMMGYQATDNFKLYAGPMVSRFMDASLVPTNQDMFASYSDNLNKTTLGYQVGFGITSKKSTFGLQFRDNIQDGGLSATFRQNLMNFKQSDRVIQFAFSYRLFDKKLEKKQQTPDIFFNPEEISAQR